MAHTSTPQTARFVQSGNAHLSQSTPTQAVLEWNKEDREAAEQWIVEFDVEHRRPRFWEELAKLAAAKVGMVLASPITASPKAWSDKQANAFMKEFVPYGVYVGRMVEDVPPSYFERIHEGEFNQNVMEYMKTNHYKERLAAERRHG